MSDFKTFFPREEENVRNCLELTDAQRAEFFRSVAGVSTPDEVRKRAQDFFHRHKLLGSVLPVRKAEERFGHLREWKSIEKTATAIGVTKDKLEAYRESALLGRLSHLEELLDALEDAQIGPVVWCFQGDDPNAPFKSASTLTLPCRLGLRELGWEFYLFLEISGAPEVAGPKKPTAFDGGFNGLWCLGGKTCPRAECNTEVGFIEAVFAGFVPGRNKKDETVSFKHALPAGL